MGDSQEFPMISTFQRWEDSERLSRRVRVLLLFLESFFSKL
jgi:hypothetical protein